MSLVRRISENWHCKQQGCPFKQGVRRELNFSVSAVIALVWEGTQSFVAILLLACKDPHLGVHKKVNMRAKFNSQCTPKCLYSEDLTGHCRAELLSDRLIVCSEVPALLKGYSQHASKAQLLLLQCKKLLQTVKTWLDTFLIWLCQSSCFFNHGIWLFIAKLNTPHWTPVSADKNLVSMPFSSF